MHARLKRITIKGARLTRVLASNQRIPESLNFDFVFFKEPQPGPDDLTG
jgi:hypothetical protein